MKKSDLENGMIVECGNGKRYIVIKNFTSKTKRFGSKDIMLGDNGFVDFKDYNDDLLEESGSIDWNIDKVYYREFLGDERLKLLWERKVIELTDDERKLLEVAYNQGYRWIAKDALCDYCNLFKQKPEKDILDIWDDSTSTYQNAFVNMFEFIVNEDEEPYSIEELLKGELKK